MLRAILVVKSSYYHRILHPSDAPCSNDYLLSLAYPHALPINSLLLSPSRTLTFGFWATFLGTLLKWSTQLCCSNSLSLRTISSPHRRGAPRGHWPETAVAESQFRILCLTHGNRPEAGNFHHTATPCMG